jgi:acylphosphatase
MSEHAVDRVRLHAVVRGRVQGVNFRAFAADHARRLRIAGSVRNLRDGQSVGVIAEGSRQAVEDLLALLHQGPRFARVDGVEHDWLPPMGLTGVFQVVV